MTPDKHSIAFVNGDVWTMNEQMERRSGLLIIDGEVALVGDDTEVSRAARERSVTVIDLHGNTVLPGFIDAHTHLEMTVCSNQYWLQAHTPPHRSLESMKKEIAESLNRTDFAGWMVVRSSFRYQDKIEDGRLITRQELDELAPDRPLAVAAGLHVQTLNTEAMKQLGILDAESSETRVIHRDENGEATGVVTEVWSDYPGFTREELATALREQLPETVTRYGVTTLASIAYHSFDSEVTQKLIEEGFPLRHLSYIHVPRVGTLEEAIRDGLRSETSISQSGVGGVKIFVDGQHGDGLEEVFDDYKWTQEELNVFVREATDAGIQLMMHALSPGALRRAVLAVERCNQATGTLNPMRHRVEHGGDYLDLADVDSIRRAGVILVTTPQFITSAGNKSTISPLRSILDANITVVAGTDTTGTVPEGASPLYNIACAIHRGSRGSDPEQSESVTFSEALRMFTADAAFSLFEESDKGQIRSGYVGDLAILDRPIDTVADTREYFDVTVAATVFSGEIVHGTL